MMLVVLAIAVASLICVATLGTSIDNVRKCVVVVGLFVAASAVYFSFESYKGWPSDQRRPDTVTLLWVEIYEPKGSDPGHIVIMVRSDSTSIREESGIFDYVPLYDAPRLYEVPYDREAATFYSKAQEAIMGGNVVTLENGGGGSSVDGARGEAEAGDAAEGDGGGDAALDYLDRDDTTMRIVSPFEVLRK